MPEERRETDKIILDRLDKLQETTTKTQIDLALNTQATRGVEKHMGEINGKVQAHNASIQSLQAQATVATEFIVKANAAAEKVNERKYETHDRWRWVVVGLIVSIGGQILLYIIQSDILKKIFTR